mgnify:CR=1 FL=1
MHIKEYSYDSVSGLCGIKAWQWLPDGEPIAVVQIHHGMAEHCKRYKNAINALTKMGYAVFMNDMINHGESNENENELGFFGNKNGYKNIIADARKLTEIAKNEYPNKKFIIAGHSMGSLVMRCYLNSYSDVDGAIFIGTSGVNNLAPISIVLTGFVSLFKGKKYRSNWLNNIGFSAYSKPFENRTTYDWGSRDAKSVDEYCADPKCGYIFSSRGFDDLARLAMQCNSKLWYKNVKEDLPILLMSGEMDPVGNYSKGVNEVYLKLINSNHKNVTKKIYKDARHEILNELNKEEVFEDINNWIKENVL